jgi:hypothetical protein
MWLCLASLEKVCYISQRCPLLAVVLFVLFCGSVVALVPLVGSCYPGLRLPVVWAKHGVSSFDFWLMVVLPCCRPVLAFMGRLID